MATAKTMHREIVMRPRTTRRGDRNSSLSSDNSLAVLLTRLKLRVNKAGVFSVALSVSAFVLAWNSATAAYVKCIPYTLLHLSALACSIVAAVRGSRNWLGLSVIYALLTAQAVFALLVEC